MYKIIGADQKEYGPVNADQIRQWIQENRANGQTLVLPEGGNAWVALGALPEFADALAAKAGRPNQPSQPAQPGQFTQPTLPSLAPFPSSDSVSAAILSHECELNIGSCLGRSWNLLRAHFPLIMGVNLINLVLTACFAVAGFFGSLFISFVIPIPFFGRFVMNLVLWPCLAVLKAGSYWVLLRLSRGEDANVGDFFAGLHRNGGNILLVGLLAGLGVFFGTCCCLLPGLCLYILWFFALLLIIDLRMGAIAGLELSWKVVWKNWWSMFAFVIVIELIQLIIPVIFGLLSMATFGAMIAPLATEAISNVKMPPGVELPEGFVPMMATAASFLAGAFAGYLANFLVVAPFANGAVVYAYEDLTGKKPQQAG